MIYPDFHTMANSFKKKSYHKFSLNAIKLLYLSLSFSLFFHCRGFAFDQAEMEELAIEYAHSLRDGTHDLFKELSDLNVPLLVFSAGLGDSILAVLKHADVMYPNVHIVSNFLQYENGLLNGLGNTQQTIIHTFNKNENSLKGTDYYDTVHDRKHVILMG